MRIAQLIVLSAALASVSCTAHAQGKPAPKDALLYFVWPQEGDDQGRILVSFRSAQHGRYSCGRRFSEQRSSSFAS